MKRTTPRGRSQPYRNAPAPPSEGVPATGTGQGAPVRGTELVPVAEDADVRRGQARRRRARVALVHLKRAVSESPKGLQLPAVPLLQKRRARKRAGGASTPVTPRHGGRRRRSRPIRTSWPRRNPSPRP